MDGHAREHTVAALRDISPGEIVPVEVDGTSLLLVRVGDAVHAVGATCTHYGANLADGLLVDDHLFCPWHKTCFRVTDGRVSAPPALDDLPSFPTRIVDGEILVTIPIEIPDQLTGPITGHNEAADERIFVLLGGGAAGATAAETLRREGFQGRLVMISLEERLPYDRTKLSKPFMAGAQTLDQLPWRDVAFYRDLGIERVAAKVSTVQVASREVQFADGRPPLQADRLLIATGGAPRKLDIPGADLPNVFTLRDVQDAEAITGRAREGARVVTIGDGFIGLEVAASLTNRGCDVTLLGRSEVPLSHLLGDTVGDMIKQLHISNGVNYVAKATVDRISHDHVALNVHLSTGETFPADLVVVGIGVTPATAMIDGASLADDGGVIVDKRLRVADGVWAAGDIAAFPDANNEPARVEHWRLAQQHGQIAARNMMDQPVDANITPFFWTNQFGTRIDVLGRLTDWDDVVIDGRTASDAPEFVAYYLQGDTVVGAAGVKRDQAVIALLTHLENDQAPTRALLERGYDPINH